MHKVVRTSQTIEFPLNNGIVALVSAKYAVWLSQWNWRFKVLNNDTVGYAARSRNAHDPPGTPDTVYMHRALKQEPKGLEVDHINGYGLDNQWHNIRVSTRVENGRNRGTIMGRKYKGIYLENSGRWRASIMVHGKKKHLGVFDSDILAARAYDIAAIELFGDYARLNFPLELESDGRDHGREENETADSDAPTGDGERSGGGLAQESELGTDDESAAQG